MPDSYYNKNIMEQDGYAGEKMSEWRSRLFSLEEAVKARNGSLAFSLVKQITQYQPSNPIVRSLF